MVKIYFTDEGGEFRVDMLGHGELANIEQLDVMCAVTTTLANTLSLNIKSIAECGMLMEEPTIYIGDDAEGKARILCKPLPEYHSIVKSVYITIINGFCLLAALYPEHIEFVKE